MYSFSDLEPVCCSISSSNCCFLTCIQISQEAGQVVWYSHLLKNFPQFIVIHTVKGFGIVNKAEIDVFLELSCFFDDLEDVGNLISGSSALTLTLRPCANAISKCMLWVRGLMQLSQFWGVSFLARVQLQHPGIQSEGVNCVGEKLRQPLIFLGLPVCFKLMIPFYTFTKVLGQRFDTFSSHWPRFIFLQKSLLPLNKEFLPQRFSYLLFHMCPCEYTVTHANAWAAYHIPQFISCLSKFCLPLVSWLTIS